MRPRLLILLAAAALALLGASFAYADTQKVEDEIRESSVLRENGRLDIVKTTAGHKGKLLKHTIEMRGRVKPNRKKERPILGINTRGNRTSDPEYLVLGGTIFKNRKLGESIRVGEARLTSKKRRWTYLIDPKEFPGKLGPYGWVAFTTAKGDSADVVPANTYIIHEP